jgi:hypothetical protein
MDEPKLNLRECFDWMADAHMSVLGMKNSPVRETAWQKLYEYLSAVHSREPETFAPPEGSQQ